MAPKGDVAAAESLMMKVLRLDERRIETLSFRRVADLGQPLARVELQDHHHRRMLAVLTEAEHKKGSQAWKRISGDVADHELQVFRNSVDDASVVFMHAALDAAVTDLCGVTALWAPGDWEHFVLERKVPIRAVKLASYDIVFNATLGDCLNELAGQSLLKRVDRLYHVCRPGKDFRPSGGYVLDRDRLERIDNYRHAVAHGHDERPAIGPILDEVEYLYRTGAHLWGMVNWRYRIVKIDGGYPTEWSPSGD